VVTISSAEPPCRGRRTEITGRQAEIGTLGSVVERHSGLAIIRIDKAGDAMADGTPIACRRQPGAWPCPPGPALSFPAEADEAS
jgi:hypothetical protein